jgi:hypothetical protein
MADLDLFTPIVDSKELHHNFVHTIAPNAKGVRKVLQAWAKDFVDRDGKFVREFQTTYNSGFWELYLYAVLKHLGFNIDFSHHTPDFVCSNKALIVEAAIASHAQDDTPEWEKKIKDIVDDKNIFEIWKHSTIRLSNALHTKIKKYRDGYSALAHVKNKPFIVAIANLTKADFNLHGDVPMQWLLYDGLEQKVLHKNNGSEVPLGLFRSDAFSDISGVIYSSLATFGKARALGDDVGDFLFQAVRIKDNFTPIRIAASKDEYKESLCDGLRLFLNPYASHPLNTDDFDDIGIRTFVADKKGDYLVSCHPEGDLCMRIVHHVTRS